MLTLILPYALVAKLTGIPDDIAISAGIIDHDGRLELVANNGRLATRPSTTRRNASNAACPLPGTADILFPEIEVVDPSTFTNVLEVRGATGLRPRAHFERSEATRSVTCPLPHPRPG